MIIKPRLVPVGLMDIPRAEAEIKRTIETLKTAQFEQDPLFDVGDSFRLSLCNSAIKREGSILEAAIKDAIEQTTNLKLFETDKKLNRRVDVAFEVVDRGLLVGTEIKRGVLQDSKAARQFRHDIQNIPALLATATPFAVENIIFHIVSIGGVVQKRIKQWLSLEDFGRLYGLNARSHVLTARQRYSVLVKSVLRERGL